MPAASRDWGPAHDGTALTDRTSASAAGAQVCARIGPNAVIQMGEALCAYAGREFEHDVFVRAGLQHYLSAPPEHMIPEREAIAIFDTLYNDAGVGLYDANAIARDAGLRTGDYILANRIPKFAQAILKRLPKSLAARALLAAIGKHSWTFAGSGRFSACYGRPLVIEIANNPLAFDRCAWHCAVFERLFGALVSRKAHAVCRVGTPSSRDCYFEIVI